MFGTPTPVAQEPANNIGDNVSELSAEGIMHFSSSESGSEKGGDDPPPVLRDTNITEPQPLSCRASRATAHHGSGRNVNCARDARGAHRTAARLAHAHAEA